MASWSVLLFLCALPAALPTQKVLEKKVQVGWNISLPCHLSNKDWNERPDGEQRDDKRVARWLWTPRENSIYRKTLLITMKASDENLPYVHTTQFKHRISMNLHAFESGDFSLRIWMVRPSDRGLFSCCLSSPTRKDEASVLLTLRGRATPTRPSATTMMMGTTQATSDHQPTVSTQGGAAHRSCNIILPVTVCAVSALVFIVSVIATAAMLKHS